MATKVAVFGSNGFLGSHIVKSLQNDPLYDVLELTSSWSAQGKLAWYHPQYIFHCALVGNGHTEHLLDQFELDAVVLRCARNENATLVTFGTDASYAEYMYPHTEPFYMKGEPYKQWTNYAYQKRALLNILQTGAVPMWYHFVLTNMFGPGFKLTDNHLMHDIVKKICDADPDSTIKFGRPDFLREVLYIDDVVKNVSQCVFGSQFGLHEVVNCGSSKKCLPIFDLVKTACDVLKFDVDRCMWDREQQGHNAKWLDNTALINHLGTNYADTPLAEAIRLTADYYLEETKARR